MLFQKGMFNSNSDMICLKFTFKNSIAPIHLRGNFTPNWNWAWCFVCCLKIINTFLKSDRVTLKQIV